MKVNSIVLCGNNLETWLVASFLTRRVPNIDLTILETNKEYSNKNRSSGEFLSLFIQLLEIDESDWMHKADAIFTAGSEYHKFSEKNNHFIVPNGMYELPSDQQTRLDLRTLFDVKNENSKKVNSKDILNYVTYNSWLIHKNKMTDVFKTTEGLKAPFTTSHNFTYSFSEEKMISFLKEYFCTGVRIITNESSEETSGVTVIRNEKNEIQEIKIPSYTLKADLYIDCTSNSILLNKEENEFVEVSTFIDDRKDSFTIQYKNEKEQIKNVRNSISLMAIDEGYLRKIPSWNQCSFDVVYSSKFSEEGDVEKSISKLFDHEITHNHTEVLNGSYFNSWDSNLILLGPAYSKHESKFTLSDSIICECLFNIVELINSDPEPYLIFDYNLKTRRTAITTYENDILFNLLTNYKNSKYWETISSEEHNAITSNYNLLTGLISNQSISPIQMFILLGFDYPLFNSKFRTSILVKQDKEYKKYLEYMFFGYKQYMEQMEAEVAEFPTNYEFLTKTIYV